MGKADSSSLRSDIHGSSEMVTALGQKLQRNTLELIAVAVLQCPVAGHCLPGSGSIRGPCSFRAIPCSCSSCPSCFGPWKFIPEHNTAQRSSEQPSPVSVGDLESYKKQAFVLKEGVEYRIKISFRVRIPIWKRSKQNTRLLWSLCPESGVVLKEWALPAGGVSSVNGNVLLSPCSSLCR